MFSLVWLLTGIIIGMLLMLLVLVCYEEHYMIRVTKEPRKAKEK